MSEVDDLQFSYTDQARLDWFAAHAPIEPPEWFEGPQEPYPSRPAPPYTEISSQYREARRQITLDGEITVRERLAHEDKRGPNALRQGEPLIDYVARQQRIAPTELRSFLQACAAHEDALDEWEARKKEIQRRNRIARYFAWRAYYARMVKAEMDHLGQEGIEQG